MHSQADTSEDCMTTISRFHFNSYMDVDTASNIAQHWLSHKKALAIHINTLVSRDKYSLSVSMVEWFNNPFSAFTLFVKQ